MDADQRIAGICRKALEAGLSESARLRLQTAVNDALRLQTADAVRPVMNLVEVAAYLRVTPAVIEELLGDLPCFELGGRLLFRREAVDGWIQRRERRLAYEILEFDAKHELVGRTEQ